MTPAADLQIWLDRLDVPHALHRGLLAYLLTGQPTGSFLQACLENNLLAAATRADEINRRFLYEIMLFLSTAAPVEAWGSPDRYAAWIRRRTVPRASALSCGCDAGAGWICERHGSAGDA